MHTLYRLIGLTSQELTHIQLACNSNTQITEEKMRKK